MPRLNNKVALVTGAARDIGAAICRAFADEGTQVIVTDLDEAGSAEVARAIGPAVSPCCSGVSRLMAEIAECEGYLTEPANPYDS